ncbi:MAG: preprotein translocase subunit YajC [Actinomycetota bacterium]
MQPGNFVFLGLMLVGFYFILIRPQQRRARERQQLIRSIQAGDEVVTIGGIYGRVRNMDESLVWLEVSDGMVIKVSRQAVSGKVNPAEGDAEITEEAD